MGCEVYDVVDTDRRFSSSNLGLSGLSNKILETATVVVIIIINPCSDFMIYIIVGFIFIL